MIQITHLLIVLSLLTNAFLIYKLREKAKPNQNNDDFKELTLDLISGSALIKITRLPKEDVFLKSPRGI